MGLTVRLYLFEESGAIKRIPRHLAEGLTSGEDAIPAYAGTRQRVLEAVIDNEDGKPQAIDRASGYYFSFDADGRVHEGLRESLRDVMNFAFATEPPDDEKVIPLSPRRGRQIWEDKNRWKPSSEDLGRIVADLSRKRGVKRLEDLVGVRKKRAPLTYEAEKTVREINTKLTTLVWSIAQLSEKALPGFIDEARRRSKDEPEDEYFWNAAAQEGERQREVKRLRRTGKGQWVAVYQLFRYTGPSSIEEALVEHRECEGEEAAIDAMKALVTEHSTLAQRGMSIEARTMPLLEWQLMNGRPT